MQIKDEKSFKVIIGSNDQTYRNNLGSKLRFEGFSVEFVDGGFHLLHLLERYTDQHMLILHENMSDMPSHEVISLIRTNKTKAEFPILFVSKDQREEEICDMVFTGANEYVVQQTNFAPLVDRVKKYFQQRKVS